MAARLSLQRLVVELSERLAAIAPVVGAWRAQRTAVMLYPTRVIWNFFASHPRP